MLALSSQERFVAAISRARDVTLVAYLLPRGIVFDALARAARRGAHVIVRLEGRPYYDARGGIRALNASVAGALVRAGADARLVDEDDAMPQLHAKAALVGGSLYLDDVNFSPDSNGTLLRDDRHADVRAFRGALEGRVEPASHGTALLKAQALEIEAALLAGARRSEDVVVESESIGRGSLAYSRLERLGKAGRHPRLLVSREALSSEERALLKRLRGDGVAVRVCPSNEKFAVIGARAWVGSANATSAYLTPDQLDWGVRTANRAIVTHLRSRFETRWNSAREISAT